MSRFVRASKYRHVFGKADKLDNCYQGIRLTKNAWDQNYLAANTKYMGICWESGGGAVAVLNLDSPGRLNSADVPLISGHKGPVLGLDWHRFNEDLLCTVSEDGYGRIWGIPEGGLKENLEEPLQVLKGHKRKVGTVNFHPTANNVVATSSTDYSVKIWDVEKGETMFDILEGHSDIIQCVDWSPNGSQMATTCKDKKLRIVDPRANSIAMEGQGHMGVKGSRCVYLGDTGLLFTVGFTRTSEREYFIWDPRNGLDSSLAHAGIDSASGILMPFYDDDTRVLYLAGKGDGNIRYYEMVDESPYIYFLSEYKSGDPQRGMGFVPKRAVNVSECEIAKALKVYNDKIEPISFKVPRKSDLFQDDIFPPTFGGEYSLTAEEWAGGADADVKKVSLENGFVAPAKQEFHAEKKEVEKELTEKEVREEHEKLQKRVAYLEAEIVKKDARIKELEG